MIGFAGNCITPRVVQGSGGDHSDVAGARWPDVPNDVIRRLMDVDLRGGGADLDGLVAGVAGAGTREAQGGAAAGFGDEGQSKHRAIAADAARTWRT
jgi:hypothetical protein